MSLKVIKLIKNKYTNKERVRARNNIEALIQMLSPSVRESVERDRVKETNCFLNVVYYKFSKRYSINWLLECILNYILCTFKKVMFSCLYTVPQGGQNGFS